MSLKSKLLGGDLELEACAVRDSAHVTQGAVGDHVAKIQEALFRLDGLSIDPGEIAAKRYGPSTADAVLKFKKKRHIINFSYQTTEDDIVGKMTIDALDKEMDALEKRLALVVAPAGKRPLDFVAVWFNMFIPKSVPGLTFPHKKIPGTTVISDVESFVFGVTFEGVIETNGRTFDSNLYCASLMQSYVSVDWGLTPPNVIQKHVGNLVTDLDPATHVRKGVRFLSNSSARFVADVLTPGFAKFSVRLSVPHPFGLPFDLRGSMDVVGELKIDRGARTVACDVMVDDFPAYEGYASELGAAMPAALFNLGVPPGKKPQDLARPPSRRGTGTVLL